MTALGLESPGLGLESPGFGLGLVGPGLDYMHVEVFLWSVWFQCMFSSHVSCSLQIVVSALIICRLYLLGSNYSCNRPYLIFTFSPSFIYIYMPEFQGPQALASRVMALRFSP